MILHIDMDAFYASVEIRDRPELQNQPVIVGGTPTGRGVVAAANYVARKHGVHSAMPAARAKRLCPGAIFLRPRMNHYVEISRQIRDIFHHFTPVVEPLSLDEAFLDVSGSQLLFGTSVEIGRQIKHEIADHLHLVASVGVAPNKFLAKLASDLDKPDGFVVVDPDLVQQFLDPLPVGRLWGVGRVTGQVFEQLGVTTIHDLRELSLESLEQQFGEYGQRMWELARGIDERQVVPDREAKSVSHETTFSQDIDDLEVLRAWAIELTEQVARRLRRHKLRGRTVHLKVRFSDFQTITRSLTLQLPTDVTQDIWLAANEMLSTRLPSKHKAVRLLGVGVSIIGDTNWTQLSLLDNEAQAIRESQFKLDHTADQIHEKFGASSLGRASSLLHRATHTPQPKPDDPPT